MDPVTALVAVAISTSTITGGVAIVRVILRALRTPDPGSQPPSNSNDNPLSDMDDGPNEREVGEESSPYEHQLQVAIDMLTHQVPLARSREFVGYRHVRDEAIGRRIEEALHPDAGFIVRPINGFDEMGLLLPEEQCYGDDELLMRIITGEALVEVPVANVPIMRPVHEEVYKDVFSVLYLSLDASSSMNEAWRPPIWRGVVRRLLSRAQEVGAISMLRLFTSRVHEMYRATGVEEYSALQNYVACVQPHGNTSLMAALTAAVEDMTEKEFDHAVIVMVSDGEDQNFDASAIRGVLDEVGIELHVIMLGVENEELRRCADVYQVIEQDLTVHKPRYRS